MSFLIPPLLLLFDPMRGSALDGWAHAGLVHAGLVHAGSALAQADGGGGAGALTALLPFVAMLALVYFLFVVPQRTKDKRFQQMLDGIKENDRVVTTGGLHGVVTNIQRDAGRLTLRVDESTGAKVRVALWAIDSVERDD
ncbi:preprotein translocase subunit YajC [Botrimarina sp.]|uniref:preprotein translocase subunit YajC n=1 Tax=Botrimarina sp. TaxID=2795802 RepID=UPI0032EE7EDA